MDCPNAGETFESDSRSSVPNRPDERVTQSGAPPQATVREMTRIPPITTTTTSLPPAKTSYALHAFVSVVCAAVILTAFVGGVTWHRNKAKHALDAILSDRDPDSDPRELIVQLEDYVINHPENELTRQAVARIESARLEVDDFDYRQSLRDVDSAGIDLDAANRALTRYVNSHPAGRHVDKAKKRIRRFGEEKDDLAYRETQQGIAKAPQDFEAEKGALETYLATYPDGRHVTEARGRLATLPERAEQARFQQHLHGLDELVVSRRFPEALEQIDRAILDVNAPSRRKELARKADEITSMLEEIDAQTCLHSVENRQGRDALANSCRLFLLCYASSRYHDDVERQLDAIAKFERDEQWQSFAPELIGASPEESLTLLKEYQQSSGDYSPRVMERVASSHALRLCKEIEQSLHGFQLIHAKNGASQLGTNVQKLGKRILFKGVDGKWSHVERDQFTSTATPKLLTDADHLGKNIERRAERDKIDLSLLRRELKQLLKSAATDALRRQHDAIEECLKELLVCMRPQFEMQKRAEPPATARVQIPNVLAYYQTQIESDTSLEHSALALLPEVYEYKLYETLIEIPLTRAVKRSKITASHGSGIAPSPRGEITVEFSAAVTRDSSFHVTQAYQTTIDTLLQSINQRLKVVAVYEIRSETVIRNGIGVKLKTTPAGIVAVGTIPGGPATDSGIETFDRLVRVNDLPLSPDTTLDQIEAMIVNAPASDVVLTLVRSQRRFRVSLTKTEYELERFSWRTTLEVEPSTAFGSLKQQSEWMPIEPPV